jgi:hypothetical protein
MNENQEAVKRRVRKLLALSKSRNENEAAAALEKALALMEARRLTEEECLYAKESVPATKGFSRWRAVLSEAVAWLYCCVAYRVVYRDTKTGAGEIVFYGESFDAFIAGEMYRYLAKTIERMARRDIRKGAPARYREKYKLGAASRLYDRIHGLGEAAAWTETRGKKLRAVRKAAEQEVSPVTKTFKITGRGDGAFERGEAAGDGVSLNRQAAGHGGRLLEENNARARKPRDRMTRKPVAQGELFDE